MKQEQVVQEVTGPLAVRQKDPEVWAWYQRVKEQQQQQQQMMAQMQQMMAQMQGMQGQPPMGGPPMGGMPPGMEGPPPGMGGAPLPSPGLDSTVLPPQMQAVTGIPGAGDPAAIQAMLAATNGRPPGGY
jgi:hypothetical protein